MKIKFESDDDLSLGKILNIPMCIITVFKDLFFIRSVFQESNNYYSLVYLHECFYEDAYEYENDSYSIV